MSITRLTKRVSPSNLCDYSISVLTCYDVPGMYSFRYNPHYWLAKKPWTASSSPAGGKEEL